MLIYLNLSAIIVVNVDEFYKTSSWLADTDESGKFDTHARVGNAVGILSLKLNILLTDGIYCHKRNDKLLLDLSNFRKLYLFKNIKSVQKYLYFLRVDL